MNTNLRVFSFESAEAEDKPKGFGQGMSHACARPVAPSARLLVIFALLPLFSPMRALAQKAPTTPNLPDMTLEELMLIDIDSVYGASGFKQKVTEAPASVTIITSDQIQRYGYRTLADILRNVPGFYVTYDRNYSYLGVRGYGLPGQYNDSIALLIDGHRLNDNIYDGALIGTESPLDIDLIDRVEIIRGPNSSLYVASAFLGVINIITKRPQDLPKVNATGAVGSYGTYQGHISYGKQFSNGLELLLSGTVYDSHGQDRLSFKDFTNPATNNGIAVNADDDEFHQLFLTASWGGFTLHGLYGSRDKGIPTAPFGSAFNVTDTRTIDARSYLDLTYERDVGHGLNVRSRTYYDQSTNDGTYVYNYSASGGPSRVLNKNFAHGKWWGEEATISKQRKTHRLSVGGEVRDNFQQDQGNYDLQPFVYYFSDSRTSTVFSIYAQDEIHLRHNLILNLGLRYDRYSLFGGTTNPRAALIYNPWDKTTFKFLYGHSFRAPNLFELFYDAPGNEANPSLRPQTVKTMEAVWEQYFANHFRMTLTGFYYPIHSLINEQIDPANGNAVFVNADCLLDLRGFDFAMSRSLTLGLEGTVSYSFQDATVGSAGQSVTNSPKHLVQTSLSIPLIKRKVFASTDLQYVSKRATLAGPNAAPYVVPNFTLYTRDLLNGWDISASLYNGFNRRYTDPSGNGLLENTILQDGRTVRIKIGYRFR